MAGQRVPTVNKPSRSDEVYDPGQQIRIAEEVRAQFESLAPKRPTKPNRSEPDPDASPAHHLHADPILELQKLLSLSSLPQPQVFFSTGGESAVQEEFIETQYYKELISIDKQHHTTGTGFIKAVKEGVGNGWDYELSENGGDRKMGSYYGFNSNPATNDWTPCEGDPHSSGCICLQEAQSE